MLSDAALANDDSTPRRTVPTPRGAVPSAERSGHLALRLGDCRVGLS